MILVLLPHCDYDPTESSVPWQYLHRAGIEVRFATPQGTVAHADPRLVEGGFGPLNPLLMTRKPDLESYRAMLADPHFQHPLAYADVDPEQFDGLLVPGGHAEGMRSLLESSAAQQIALHLPRSATAHCCSPEPLIPIPHARYCSVARSPACCL